MSEFIFTSLAAGVLGAVLLIGLDFAFKNRLPVPETAVIPTRFQGFLASFYGGVAEEILVRLFAMSLLVYGANFLGLTGPLSYWLGIIFAALLFGAGHLPAAFGVYGKSRIMVIRTLVLNGIAGLVFGWLFWQYGLESAILAHFTADILVHVVTTPGLYKTGLEGSD